MTFEERVARATEEKLSDDTVEKLIGECIEKAVKEALNDSFSRRGKGYKLIQEKLDSVLIPAIESYDFNRYIIKLDEVLTGIINDARLVENRKILKNFQGLMKEPEL